MVIACEIPSTLITTFPRESTWMHILCSYTPIISSSFGRQAVKPYDLPPFIDGSCRREPDFQSVRLSISSLCRFRRFAPRLHLGDCVIYVTKKGSYLEQRKHWRLVARLTVTARFENHEQAAKWYMSQGFNLPSNCIVRGNAPESLERTHKIMPPDVKKRLNHISPERAVRLWDIGYQQRSQQCGIFLALATTPDFLELYEPPILYENDMTEIFGRIPGTQTPPNLTENEVERLDRHFSEIIGS